MPPTKGEARGHYASTARKALALARSVTLPEGEDERPPYPQGAATPEEKLAASIGYLEDCLRAHRLVIHEAEFIVQDARAALARCYSRVT